METIKSIFHKISYLQYPLVGVAFYFYVLFLLSIMQQEQSIKWSELNNVLVFFGLAISFSTLQDTNKTQNKLSRKIWEHPKKGKFFLIVISFFTLFLMIGGITGFFLSNDSIQQEISFGLLVLGISLIGLLKAAIEMFENHRLDKKKVGGAENKE